MPHIISFNGNCTPDFVVSEGPWAPRLSGDFTSNLDHLLFLEQLTLLVRQVLLGRRLHQLVTGVTIVGFGAVIVTSRSGDPFNFWINDAIVSDDDPIDLFLGDTDASEINSIIPFESLVL